MKARYKIAVSATVSAVFSLYLFMVANWYSPCMRAFPASAPRSSSTVLGTTLEYRK